MNGARVHAVHEQRALVAFVPLYSSVDFLNEKYGTIYHLIAGFLLAPPPSYFHQGRDKRLPGTVPRENPPCWMLSLHPAYARRTKVSSLAPSPGTTIVNSAPPHRLLQHQSWETTFPATARPLEAPSPSSLPEFHERQLRAQLSRFHKHCGCPRRSLCPDNSYRYLPEDQTIASSPLAAFPGSIRGQPRLCRR